MNLEDALQNINVLLLRNPKYSSHFIEQCKNRSLDLIFVKEILSQNHSLVGIVSQGLNRYKLWLKFKKDKDLNIFIELYNTDKLTLITAFPCNIERRLR